MTIRTRVFFSMSIEDFEYVAYVVYWISDVMLGKRNDERGTFLSMNF